MMDFTAGTKVLAHVPRSARTAWGIRRASQSPYTPDGMHFVTPRGRVIVKVLADDRFEVTVNRRKPLAPVITTVDGPNIVPTVNAIFGVAS